MAAEIMTPLERVASTPKGQQKSPYPDFANIADEGHRKYMAAGCNGEINPKTGSIVVHTGTPDDKSLRPETPGTRR
jgi:hypothetical protein